jgi:tetratricopeptide (TPR) repeat protein
MSSFRDNVRQLIREAHYGEAFRAIRQDLESAQVNAVDSQKRIWSLYFACISLFGLGHIQQARRYFEELLRIAGDSVSARYVRAYLELQSRRPEDALVTLTSILELDPSDTRCDALIEQLKEHPEDFADYSRKRAGILDFFPGIAPDGSPGAGEGRQNRESRGAYDDDSIHRSMGSHGAGSRGARGGSSPAANGLEGIRFKSAADGGEFAEPRQSFWSGGVARKAVQYGAFLLVMLSIGGLALFYFQRSDYSRLAESNLPRPPGHSSVLPPEAGEFVYTFSSKEDAVALYEQARLAVEEGRVNQARRMLGRLERSNVDFVFKERARTLRQSIPLPTMKDFRDSITIAEIRSDPYSYRDAVFLWDAVLESVRPSGTGISLEIRPDGSDSVRMSYTGSDSNVRSGLRDMQVGERLTVYGRVLASDAEGRQLQFQLLDYRQK